MNVKNRKCIRKLSLKSLYANRRRNLIAIFAIALTTLLFTSMFTIVLSLNASYETYQFRQVGGYAHGTFKDVSPEQAERIAAHPKVKAAGARKVIGITAEGVFAKIPAEISYMDANCTKWSYATPTTGRMPESGKEVAMDTAALQLLGVTPELGAEVTVSYSITDKDQTAFTVTDTFDKLQVFDGDISPMLEPDNNAIAIAVSLDDYGNLPNPEYYPKVGDTITATYADDVKYIDSRTGELCNEDTPEEYLQAKLYGARDVEYTVCALVELPNSMGYRYGGIGYNAVLPVDTAQRDSGGAVVPMLYLFDTADEADEAEAEQYLSKLTSGEFSPLMYESKATVRSEFAQFRQMFLLIGGILCAIIGLVGLLNFFNAMMTGILSRRREFAVLQAVGMTPRQLKTMLIYEGLFYAMSSVSVAFVLSLAVGPLAGKMLGSMFWFFEYRFTVLPVLLTIPVFLLLGWLIPCMMYDNAAKCSIVDQLRDAQ